VKEAELLQHATCSLCKNKIMHTGLPLFWRVTVEYFGLDLRACERQQGLAMLIGNAALAQVMGPDDELAKPIGDPVKLTVCEACARENLWSVARLAERGCADS
jgi:hypothetical protein